MLADAGLGLLFLCRIKDTLSREKPKTCSNLCSTALSIFYCAYGFGCVSPGLGISSQVYDWTVKSTAHTAWEKRQARVKKETENIGEKYNIDKINFYTRKLRGTEKQFFCFWNWWWRNQAWFHSCMLICVNHHRHTPTHTYRERVRKSEWESQSDKDLWNVSSFGKHLFVMFVYINFKKAQFWACYIVWININESLECFYVG